MKRQVLLRLLCVVFLSAVSAYAGAVTNTNDHGEGSLRQAIAEAAKGDVIEFQLEKCPCTIELYSGELVIDKPLTIKGPGADQLTISGGGVSRVFLIETVQSVVLVGLRIANGAAPAGKDGCTLGGGVYSMGDLTISDSEVSDNLSPVGGGGGIFSGGSLSLVNTTVKNNTSGHWYCNGSAGGVLFTSGSSVHVSNSTVARNDGGGIGEEAYLEPLVPTFAVGSSVQISESRITENVRFGLQLSGTGGDLNNSEISGNSGPGILAQAANLSINNSTVSGNGTGVAFSGYLDITNSTIVRNGIGIEPEKTKSVYSGASFRNSIIAESITKTDLSGESADFVSLGYNLVGNVGGSGKVFAEIGDRYGVDKSPLDPMLEELTFNGGLTRTHALLPGSPAIDMGDSSGSKFDQRGMPRQFLTMDWLLLPGDGSDTGSYEHIILKEVKKGRSL